MLLPSTELGCVALSGLTRRQLAADAMHPIVEDRRRAQERLRDQPVVRFRVVGRDAPLVTEPPVDVRRIGEQRAEQLVGSARRVPAREGDVRDAARRLGFGDQCGEQVGGSVGGRFGCGMDGESGHVLVLRRVARNRAISAFVDESCSGAASLESSGMIRTASTFPSSTPHWSNESTPQITPWVKTLCS